ncbi:MAG: HDOD domain-containing protein [Kiritimatiellae bacterium]|nr:HDOD domain-containing protein [Kiritimatiellia bacterium]
MSVDAFRQKVERALVGGQPLATLWSVIQKIDEITADPHSSARELARVIGSDQVLTGKVLRVVNSAAFGFGGRITNLDQAIVVLGYNPLKNLCTGLLAIRSLGLGDRADGFSRRALWRHSLGTAVVCKLIQTRLSGQQGADLFVAGLLANIGRVVLDQHFAEEFGECLRLARKERIALTDAETQVFGVSHAEVGWWTAKVWNLDESLAKAIKYHHGPAGYKEAQIVNLGYVLIQALEIGSPGDPRLTALVTGTLPALGLDDVFSLTDLLRDIEEEIRLAEPVLRTITEE